MSKNSEKITVAMARAASITLGRDATCNEDIHTTLVRLSHAFQTSIKTILSEDDALNLHPLEVSIMPRGVICTVVPSAKQTTETVSGKSWNYALEKLGDSFLQHGASVTVNEQYAEFVVPINLIKPALLDHLDVGQPR